MRDFQFYVTDSRFSVRWLMFVQTKSAETARSMAHRLLANLHNLAVEVWDGDDRLFTLDAADGRPAPAPRRWNSGFARSIKV